MSQTFPVFARSIVSRVHQGRLLRVSDVLLAVFLAVSGCRNQTSSTHDSQISVAPAVDPLPGTVVMASKLDSIYREGLAHPFKYYHLNGLQAESLRVQMEHAQEPERWTLRYQYIRQLINAGELDRGIRELEQFIEDYGEDARTLTPESKPLYETLAIAYLRHAELENCILNHTGSACILPFDKEAVHKKRAYSQKARALYDRLMEAFPDDLTSRWLLNISAMTLDEFPDGIPESFLIKPLIRSEHPRIPRYPNIAPLLGVDDESLAGGVCLEDFNNDGFIDIFVTAYGLKEQSRFFMADGRGGFIDHTEAAGLKGLVSGLNAATADYNNDGYVDIMIMRGAWLGDDGSHPNSLLKNNGDGTFEDVTVKAGLLSFHPTQNGTWSDFNNDGWIDLFIGNESGVGKSHGMGGAAHAGTAKLHPSELYMNNGDGTFTNVARKVGVDVNEFVKGSTWGDVNNDGLRDLFVSIMGKPKRLYINRGGTSGSDWRFEEVGAKAGVTATPYTFSSFMFDYNNDGLEDIYVASFDPTLMSKGGGIVAAQYLDLQVEGSKNHLFRNNGDGTFTNVAPAMGLDLCLWTMGLNFGDINTDGFPDIYHGTGAPDLRTLMPNRMFLNEGGKTFRDVTIDGGFGHLQKGHAIAYADLDRDGDEDVYAQMGGAYQGDYFRNALYENPNPEKNNWVELKLEGRTANRAAIGARIRVITMDAQGNKHVFYKTVNTGGSFGASSLLQEIGLGKSERIEEVRITWPNRNHTVDIYRNLKINHFYRIIEGQRAIPLNWKPIKLGGIRVK